MVVPLSSNTKTEVEVEGDVVGFGLAVVFGPFAALEDFTSVGKTVIKTGPVFCATDV